MQPKEQVYAALKAKNIDFEVVKHPPALTTAQADAFIAGRPGVRTKSLFLRNRKKTAFMLLIMDDTKPLDLKEFAACIGQSRLSFASDEQLAQKLGLSPGVVSIFGLLNNTSGDICVYLDKEMLSAQTVTFHPNVNTETIFFPMRSLTYFLEANGFAYTVVDI